MVSSPQSTETYEIGISFYRSLEQKAAGLEIDAHRDELFAADLADQDHKRRHQQLVQIQREHAAMLREFLTVVKIRPESRTTQPTRQYK
jgi:hypothetical protein